MLVLMAHGSRDAAWRRSMEDLVAAVRAGSPQEEVRLAYMQFTGPTLSDLVEEATAEGHRSFRILPLFMASAGHVDKDIKPLMQELASRFPEAEMELLKPVGESPLFPSLILNIADPTPSQGLPDH